MSRLSRFIHFFTTDTRNNDGPTTGWLKRNTTPAAVMHLTDAIKKPVNDLVIAIEPVQSGSGDPSPDNVRQITGWTGANIYVEKSYSASASPKATVSWQTEAGTVYGGTLDVTTGVLTVTRVAATIKSLGFAYQSSYTRFYTSAIKNTAKIPPSSTTNLVCEVFECVKDSLSPKPNNVLCMATSGNLFIFTTTYTSKTDLETAVGDCLISYELATPTVYQLTPTEVSTLLGENYIWADTGNVNSIAYYSTDETCSPLVGSGKVGSMSIA